MHSIVIMCTIALHSMLKSIFDEILNYLRMWNMKKWIGFEDVVYI